MSAALEWYLDSLFPMSLTPWDAKKAFALALPPFCIDCVKKGERRRQADPNWVRISSE